MSEKPRSRTGCLLKTSLGCLAVLLLAAILLVALGVVVLDIADGKITITIYTAEVEKASEKAVEKTGEALQKTGQRLRGRESEPESPP